MSYRDDLEAAQMRADAAERRATSLEKQLARQDDAERAAHPEVPIPAKFVVTQTTDALTVTWRWFRWFHLFLFGFALAWDGFLVFWYSKIGETDDVLFIVIPLVHVAVGIVLSYLAVGKLLNSTTVTARFGRLQIRHSPLPWPGTRVLPREELKQLFAREQEHHDSESHRTTYTYQLGAMLASGKERVLLRGLEESGQARYLERIFEQHLGIADRPVLGELPK